MLPTAAVLLAVASGCGAEHASSHCNAPKPAFAAGSQPGTTSAQEVGLAVRDATTTMVALCLAGGALPPQTPVLLDGGRTARSAGGVLVQRRSGWVDYLFYPPTSGRRVELLGARSRSSVSFGPPPAAGACPRTTAREIRFRSCGMLDVVDWVLPFRLAPSRVAIVDARVLDGATGHPLGFYLYGLSRGGGGRLRLTFAVQSPRGNRLVAQVAGISTTDGRLVGRHLPALAFRLRR